MLTATRPASPVPRPRAATLSSPVRSGWKPDLLVVCVAIYIATAVGRLHEVFPVLGYFKPTLLSAGPPPGLYLLARSRMRAPGRLLSPIATYVIGLVVWGALTVPGALNQGAAFHGWLDLAWSIVMCLVVAGSVRRTADIERLVLIYFAVTAVDVGVGLSRFPLRCESGGESGAGWWWLFTPRPQRLWRRSSRRRFRWACTVSWSTAGRSNASS